MKPATHVYVVIGLKLKYTECIVRIMTGLPQFLSILSLVFHVSTVTCFEVPLEWIPVIQSACLQQEQYQTSVIGSTAQTEVPSVILCMVYEPSIIDHHGSEVLTSI